MKWYNKINISLIIGIAYIGFYVFLLAIQVGTPKPAYIVTWEFPIYAFAILCMAFILGYIVCYEKMKR